jgi:phenylacetate-CoA ligase
MGPNAEVEVPLYARFLNNLAFPTVNRLRGRKGTEHLRFLQDSQWWSPEQIDQYQWTKTKSLIDLAAASVPYYQNLFKEMGAQPEDFRTWADFRRIPVLSREKIATEGDRFVSNKIPKERLLRHATGGSSGVPLRFYRTIDSYDWRLACTQRAYGWANGWCVGRRTMQLWGAPVGHPPLLARWKEGTSNTVKQMRSFATFVQNEESWRQIVSDIASWKPEYLIGYVSSLIEFCRFLESSGSKVHGVKAILAAAEPLTPSNRNFIEHVLQTPVFNTYGSREFMSIAAECEKHDGMHIHCENLLVETEAPESADTSDILVTDFNNHGTVFLRYRIGDLGRLSKKQCACGRGLTMLETVEGRNVDLIELAGGRVVSGIFWRHTLKDIPEIVSYQVRQTGVNSIEVLALMESDLSEKSSALFASEMQRVLSGTEVSLRRVEKLIQSGSGKPKAVIRLGDAEAKS